MSFPKYPEYKDSGVEWLGEVPAHWGVKQLKYLVTCLDGQRIPLNGVERYSKQGSVPYWGANKIMDYVDEAIFDEELVLLGEDGAPFFDVGKPVAFHSSGPVWPNNHIHVLRPGDSAWVKSIVYGLNATNYIDFVEGSTRDKLTQSRMMSIPLAWPPHDERNHIDSFLDHETARIDALVEEQQRLIELLKEKRQAVISHAVTKGLDPDVPMKDSGVEWLGEVPAHWNVVKFKYLIAEFEQGWSPQCDGDQAETLDEWGVLKVGCVNYGVFDPTENKRLPDNLEPRPELSIRKDDLLISRANTRDLVGSAAHVPMDYPKLMASDKIFVVRLHQRICRSRYAVVYLFGKGVRHQIELQATGASSSMLNIGQGAIRELWIPLPPDSEQDRIVHELEKREADFAALEQETVRHMRILNERRSALISAAVTGKIDVRGWQADQQSRQSEILMAAETRATYG